MVRHHPDVAKLENAVWNFCRGVAENPRRGRRMLIHGLNGNGKSKAMRAIRRWVQDRAIDLPLDQGAQGDAILTNCHLINWAARCDEMKSGAWDIDDLIEPTILLIDDIGAEHDPSKVGLEKLYLVLERRERRWTAITTNLSPEMWKEKFSQRVADRLFRNCDHVDLSNLPSFSAQ